MERPRYLLANGGPRPRNRHTHDQFAISFSKPAAFQKVDTLLETKSEEEARRLFRLCSQSQWSYETAKRELGKGGWKAKAIQVLYRPFDVRWTIFDSNVAVHRRTRMTDHMLAHNIALLTSRLTKGEEFRHVQVTERIPEVISMSPKISNNGFVFPLYLFRSSCKTKSQRDLFEDADPATGEERHENLTPTFRRWLDERYRYHYTPEEILGYLYGVLNAESYRLLYRDFLQADFPRIPFPKDRAAFEQLSHLGWELVEAHLMRRWPDAGLGRYRGDGDNMVHEVRYVPAEQAVYINGSQRFAPVPSEIWAFHIGGYQVLRKYLKDRRGRTHGFGINKDRDWPLTLDEIENVEKVVNILSFTIDQMHAIDEAYRAAFPEYG